MRKKNDEGDEEEEGEEIGIDRRKDAIISFIKERCQDDLHRHWMKQMEIG